MPVALLKFKQAAVVGSAGEALLGDLAADFEISNSNNADVGSWELQILEVPFGSGIAKGVLAQANGSTPTGSFTPDVAGGVWRIQLRVWPGINRQGTVDTDIRWIGVLGTNGLLVPPPMVWPEPFPDPRSGRPLAKPNESNFGGALNGWAGNGSDGLVRHALRLIGSSDGGSAGIVRADWAFSDKGLWFATGGGPIYDVTGDAGTFTDVQVGDSLFAPPFQTVLGPWHSGTAAPELGGVWEVITKPDDQNVQLRRDARLATAGQIAATSLIAVDAGSGAGLYQVATPAGAVVDTDAQVMPQLGAPLVVQSAGVLANQGGVMAWVAGLTVPVGPGGGTTYKLQFDVGTNTVAWVADP